MSERIDRAWRMAHPLPPIDAGQDKNSRGRVLLVGGSRLVPGGLMLTAEAALRTGAGKVRMATIEACAIPLGIAMPECGMLALAETDDGEIGAAAAPALVEELPSCHALIVGPAMAARSETSELLRRVLDTPREDLSVLLDAAAIPASKGLEDVTRRHGGRVILTPHHGEMAALTGCPIEQIEADPGRAARDVSRKFGAIVVLKAAATLVATPDSEVLRHDSDCPGLATGGSGDVLAGVIGGLLARGAAPLVAASWGVWLHSAAGNDAAARHGPLGFLARDLPSALPRLLAAHSRQV